MQRGPALHVWWKDEDRGQFRLVQIRKGSRLSRRGLSTTFTALRKRVRRRSTKAGEWMDETILFHCESGQKLNAPHSYAGRSFKCPKCGVQITVPSLQPQTSAMGSNATENDFLGSLEEEPEQPKPMPCLTPPVVVLPKKFPGEFVGGWRRLVGRWMAIVGFMACIRYMFFFDQSILSGKTFESSRVVNMGLANDRIVGMIWGLMLVSGGGVIQIVDTLKEI